MFERCVAADEPLEMNFIKKHARELEADGIERPAARLFSNPPGELMLIFTIRDIIMYVYNHHYN